MAARAKTLPRASLEGLVGQPLEDPGLFHHPHDDHHGHEQEDDVHVHGLHGVFKFQDGVIGVERPDGIGDEHEQGRPQQGRQGAVHDLEGDQRVDQQQDQGGDPEGRGDGPFHFQGLVGQKDGVALFIHPFRQHLVQHHPGRGLVGGLGRLHFHLGARESPFRHL